MANSLANVTINGNNVLDILATQTEISHMSDVDAVGRIDLLRESAHEASSLGEDQAARAMLNNAVQIAESNYVCTDVITEYADFLEEHGLPEYASEYRALHQELTDMLADHGLPSKEYEHRLHQEAEDLRERPQATVHELESERLDDVAAQSVAAASQLMEGRVLDFDPGRSRE